MSLDEQQQAMPILVIGPFRLHRRPRLLCLGDAPVRLGGRAIELLIVLAERAGEVVSREELERHVWPHSMVEDSSLRAHIAALRKALGDGKGQARYIANVPGRGYSLVASVVAQSPQTCTIPATHSPIIVRPLPVRMTSVLGRDDAIRSLCVNLPVRRLATIAGHGGMGKTALALAVAYRLQPAYPDGACFVDLATLSDAALVPDALAAALGITVFGDATLPTVVAWLQPRRMLLVVDNCEHLLVAATSMVDRILRVAPGIDVLATSREPLDADGEWVHRLKPLACPPGNFDLDCEAALEFPALRLLVERATASGDTFVLSEETLASAVALCRRLDGVPLAIEFAAARVGLLGVENVVTQLDDRLRLLGSGRRTVLPRHRTLRALLDWSHELLSDSERRVLRGCGVFHGPFTLESAMSVLSGPALDAAAVRDAVLGLIGKSLIVSEAAGSQVSLSMLEITRAYALEWLSVDPEYAAIARQHAVHMIALVTQREIGWETEPRAAWVKSYLQTMSNVRAALDWAFGPAGDAEIGVRLTGALMLPMARIFSEAELRSCARRALAAIEAGTPATARDAMRLHTILTNTSSPVNGPMRELPIPEVLPCFQQALDDGVRLERDDEQIEALYHIGSRSFGAGNYAAASISAARVGTLGVASASEAAILLGDRLGAQALHFMGEHARARALATGVLLQAGVRLPLRLASPVDRAVSMRIVLARILWMQGFGEQASAVASACVDCASGDLSPISLAHALCLGAIPVALWRGDDPAAQLLVERMAVHASRHAMAYWRSWVDHFSTVLAVRADSAAASYLPAGAVDAKQADHLPTFGAVSALPAALRRCEQGLVGWSAPEMLRLHGEQLRHRGTDGLVRAEAYFVRALALSQAQAALAWTLRCSTSLARLRVEQGRSSAARDLLVPCIGQFSEDLDNADLNTARALLAAAH